MFWDFLNHDMTSETIQELLHALYIDTDIHVSVPRSVSNLLLVHGNSEYAFSSDDLSWLECFGNAYTCCTDLGYDVFCVEANGLMGDYYIACAALIKLFSKAFSQRILYLFRFERSIAFGCKRDYYRQIQGNFCITQKFDTACEEAAQDFLYELSITEVDDLPWLVMGYSPQERSKLLIRLGKPMLSVDYLRFLNEFSDFYGVDTTREYERYMHEFEEQQFSVLTYHDAKEELIGVADEEAISSYETLDQAFKAEVRCLSMQEQLADITSINPQIDDKTTEFSKEAFLKADVLLEEMLYGQ